ncbi:unnamed protein product [Symbiodinium sp. CCMP2592]|nr:unnamed protein product [Symbiodinium sp. CCMP2592]
MSRTMRPIDVLCEEERLRRLSERMVYDSSDGAEHARQRRARTLVEEMSLLGSRLRSKSNEDRRFDAVEALEAGLEARRKALLTAKEGSLRASAPIRQVDSGDLQSDLADALERVTVRSVVGLRGLVEVPRPVEAVVVAVLQLVNCDYAGVDLDPSPPPTTWEEARRVLLKPGHFVSALRKFPFALQRGQILETEILQAEQAWSNVPSAGAGLSQVHEAAVHLYDWLTIALNFAASLPAGASAKSVAGKVGTAESERIPAYPRSAPGSPDWNLQPIAPSTFVASTIAPSSSERPHEPQREVQVREARNAPKQKRSLSPKLPHKPSTATTTTSDTARITTWSKTSTSSTASMSTSPCSSRSGFSASWSGLATCKPAHTRSRVSVPGASPRRSSPSPTSGLSATKPSSTRIAASSARSPQPRTRQAIRKSTSPLPKPKPKDEAEAGQPRSTGDIAPLSSSQSQISSLSSATLPTAEDFAAMRSRLDQEKREVRQIKSLESQLKWGLQREERRQTEEERREEARLIMEWRDRQAKEMKDFVEEKTREQRVQELLQSKEYQVFKREWKQAARKDEIEQIKAQLAEGINNAHWKLQLQRAVELDRQLALQETMESQQEMKELREKERQHEKTVQLQDRAHDLALEYAHQASQISSEKEESGRVKEDVFSKFLEQA